MDAAIFQTPFLAPERSAKQVFAWVVDQPAAADQAWFMLPAPA